MATTDIATTNALAKQLKDTLGLRTRPIAVKFYENEADIPAEAIFPKRDLGKKAAFCQATTLARMKRQTVAMGKDDHWCWNPMVSFGTVKAEVGEPAGDLIVSVLGIADQEKAKAFWDAFPKLPFGKFPYVVVAPVETCTFEPDVVMIYSNTHQVVWEIGAIRFMTGDYVHSKFDSIDSCIHAILEPYEDGQYKITFPDPGDRARALAREDEVIVSMPGARFGEFVEGVLKTEFMYSNLMREIGIEFENEVPPFYHELFKIWGTEE